MKRCMQFWITVVLMICFSTVSKAQVTWSTGSTIYIVANSKTALEKRITERLTGYLSKVLGKPARVVSNLASVPLKQPAIILSANNQPTLPGVSAPRQSPESFSLETGKMNGHAVVAATGNTVLGLKRAIQRLIIKSEQRVPGLVVPELHLSESPWIPKREWTVCSWSPENVRGVFSNPNSDKRLNIWLYGDKQIADYVDMFDCFGFSGCQIQETVITYGTVGSAASYRDRELKFAKSLRDNGQDVSLWVWAAQFNGYGWTDPDIVYTPRSGYTAFTDPV